MRKTLYSAWKIGVATIACSMLLLISISVCTAKESLELPARMSDKAATGLLPSVALAGNRLVAAGEHGIIVYSDDHGKNWVQAVVPVSVTLTAVYFVNASSGWAVGHDGVILSSVDGGKTWMKRFDGNLGNALLLGDAEQAAQRATGSALEKATNALEDIKAGIKFGPSRPMLGVWFRNEQEGYVVGAYGQLFHTANGGSRWESWSQRIVNPDGLHYNAISRTARGTLAIGGEGGKVYLSSDRGVTWQTKNTGYQGHIYGVLGAAGGNGGEDLVAFGFGGHILRSTDDGNSWQQIASPTKKNITGGAQLPDGTLVLAAQDGSFFRSYDQGRSFLTILPGSGLSIFGMAYSGDRQQVALAGMGGVHVISMIIATKNVVRP